MSLKLSVTDNYPIKREIAPGIHWLGGCGERLEPSGEILHSSASTFLLMGDEKTLLVDTGAPIHYPLIRQGMDEILAGRQLDYVVPSHPELPHSGNMPKLFDKYPKLRAIGDDRDYRLFYPQYADRFDFWPQHKPLPLGGGMEFTVLEAPIKDLVSTTWGYEGREQVMFVSDAFGYLHRAAPDDENPLHKPGECRLLTTELPKLPEVYQAAFLTRSALAWTGFMDANVFLNTVRKMIERYPSKLIAPTHGNVIDNLDEIMPIMRAAYTSAYETERARSKA
ncbi:MAG: MBL fold metallo-hydrolase [Bauldia sp.]